MFAITAQKGFHMTFANGNTISVQWGKGNYCNNYNLESKWGDPVPASSNAEVLAWNAEGKNIALEETDYPDVVARVCADDVARMITYIASL